MSKQLWKTIGGAATGVLIVALVMQVWVSAQVQDGGEQGLIGSWDVQVTARDCATGDPLPFLPTFAAVQTYHHGGTMLASNLGSPGVIGLEGHGVWEHGKGRQYAIAFRVLKFNPDGTFAGRDVIRDVISLGLDGNTYTSTGTVEVLAPNGDLIVRGCATTTATRFR